MRWGATASSRWTCASWPLPIRIYGAPGGGGSSAGTSITGSTPCPSSSRPCGRREKYPAAHRPLLPQHWGLLTLSPSWSGSCWPTSGRATFRELRNVVEYFELPGTYVVGVEGVAPHLLPPRRRAPGGAARPGPTAPGGLPLRAGAALRGRPGGPQRPAGREAILTAAREAGLPFSQQEVRRILAGLDQAGLVRVSRGRGGTRLTPAGRALCRRQTVEGGAEMV